MTHRTKVLEQERQTEKELHILQSNFNQCAQAHDLADITVERIDIIVVSELNVKTMANKK